MQFDIPREILDYAKLTYRHYVPNRRASGFKELASQERGSGDLSDLLASLCVYFLFCENKKVCKLDLTSGVGDKDDISIRIKNIWKHVNVKTSSYAPFRDGLNLYVKKEELPKDNIDIYIQCFVHLEETKTPHIHIAGWMDTSDELWNKAKENLIFIPKANHMGVGIKVENLFKFDDLVSKIDSKF